MIFNPIPTPVPLKLGGTHADLSATGGTSFVLRQSSVGADITASQLAASELTNGVIGSGAVVLANTPTLITPEIGAATGTSLTSSGAQLLLKQTGDTLGATQLALRNRAGSNGGIVENLKLALSDFGLAASSVITNIAIDGSNNLTVTTANNWAAGQTVTLTGLTTATFLNSKVVTIATTSSTQFTASFTHALYASAADTGTAYVQNNIRMESRPSSVSNVANIGGEVQFVDVRGDGAGSISSTIWFASGRNGTKLLSGSFNSIVGFQQNGTATSTHVLRGDGTNFVDAALAASDLSNGVTGSGAVVLQNTPTLITPTLGVALATSLRIGNSGRLRIDPATIAITSGTMNDVAIPASSLVKLAGTPGGTTTITGMTAGADGDVIVVLNSNSSGTTVTFAQENTGSTDINRIRANSSTTLTLNGNVGGATFVYSGSRWNLVSISPI